MKPDPPSKKKGKDPPLADSKSMEEQMKLSAESFDSADMLVEGEVAGKEETKDEAALFTKLGNVVKDIVKDGRSVLQSVASTDSDAQKKKSKRTLDQSNEESAVLPEREFASLDDPMHFIAPK